MKENHEAKENIRCVPKDEENPGSSNQLLFLQSILTLCNRKDRKPFLKKRKARMIHEVLVKHLSKIKRCYQRPPMLFPSHESDNHK